MLILSLVGLLAGCATPAFQLPPEATRGDKTVTAFYVGSRAQREAMCRLAGAPANSLACGNSNMLILPNPCDYTNEPYAALTCHELGHANGWPPGHPE